MEKTKNQAPSIEILYHADVTTKDITYLHGLASDDVSLSKVTWENISHGISGVATSLERWDCYVPLALGTNDIIITAFDTEGFSSSKAITIVRNAVEEPSTPEIPDGSITSEKIAANAVQSQHIMSGVIQARHIGPVNILASHIGGAQIRDAHIDKAQIKSYHIKDGTISAADIGSAQIEEAHLSSQIHGKFQTLSDEIEALKAQIQGG